MTVWATWRGKGWTPCLWSVNRRDALANCDPDEQVIRVTVTLATKKSRKRS
jgi:hypothetical protein